MSPYGLKKNITDRPKVDITLAELERIGSAVKNHIWRQNEKYDPAQDVVKKFFQFYFPLTYTTLW